MSSFTPQHRPAGAKRPLVGRIGFVIAWILVMVAVTGIVVWATYRYWTDIFRIWRQFTGLVVPQLKIMGLCALVLFATVVAVVALQVLASRWRKLRVFVTYQNAVAELAAEITEALRKHGLDAEFIPFLERDHDKLIQDVRQRLRRCDAVVAVPGEVKSFIDAELLSASTLRKPIVIVKHRPGQTLPDTAYRGYPVFGIVPLRGYDHRPLGHLIGYACNHWSDVPLNLIRALSGAGDAFMVALVGVTLLGLPRFVIEILVVAGQTGLAYRIALWTYWAFFGAFLAVFVIKFAGAVIAKFRAIRTVKQDVVTGAFTYDRVEEGLGFLSSDREILSCLEREPLALRHP